jgi:hypothetical protein
MDIPSDFFVTGGIPTKNVDLGPCILFLVLVSPHDQIPADSQLNRDLTHLSTSSSASSLYTDGADLRTAL